MEKKNYLLGLDIGTNSVGWALTDEDYNIVKKQGKSLWGVRLFEEASTAEERRLHRTSRRRLQRRKFRLSLLQELFANEICKVDKNFFQRLDDSRLTIDDKQLKNSYTLFNDINYSDKDYFHEYKTIYHLIKELIEEDKKTDIRKLYLACSFLIKYRGHFLYEGDFELSDSSNLKNLIYSLNDILDNYNKDKDDDQKLNDESRVLDNFFEELNKVKGKKDTEEKLIQILLDDEKPSGLVKIIIKTMSGSSIESLVKGEIKAEEKVKLDITSQTFDEDILSLKNEYPNFIDIFNAIILAKGVYDLIRLNKNLKGKQYLYEVYIEKFEKHKKQLGQLKDYCILHPELKKKIFGLPYTKDNSGKKVDINNYTKYIGTCLCNGKKISTSHCSRDDFYKFLKETLGLKNIKKAEDIQDETLREIFSNIEDKSYLERQNSAENNFPMQLNKAMLEKILNNQKKYYSFLNDKDEDGSVLDKIVSLLTFRVPYYVGPLYAGSDENKKKFSWVKKITNEKVTPWNFNKVVDIDESAKIFINRMQNKCTYLPDCYCLPKKSILYSKYEVLTELNKLNVNGNHISKEEKLSLIEEVYYHHSKVTINDLKDWFKKKNGENCVEITTSNDKEKAELVASLSSMVDFINIFGEDFVKKHIDTIEDIIFDITIFEDKAILKKRLEKKYSKIIDEDKIKKICKLAYKDWGRLSKKFLLEFKPCDENGEVIDTSIIKIMENENLILQEILFLEKYHYQDRLREYRNNVIGVREYNMESIKKAIDESYVSPMMKRSLIQSFKIILELEKIVKQPINNFFIECARGNVDGKKKTDDSRYAAAKKFIEEAKKQNKFDKDINFEKLEEKLNKYENDKSAFRSDRIYLYFTQLGRCLYTGEQLDFEGVLNGTMYDIDHIYPQSKVKDDSLDNRVLVLSTENRNKGENYPYDYPNRRKDYNPCKYFKFLKENKLISEKKFNRLTRKEELSDEELQDFVNRQLVSTNQSAKALKDLLEEFKEKPTIVFSKANHVSSYRQKFDLVKCRDANDYHHAHDAYLNIIIGRTIYEWFNKGHIIGWIERLKQQKKTTNPEKIFEDENNNKKPFYSLNGKLIYGYSKTVEQIKKNLYTRFDIMVTTRTYINNTIFSKDSITPKSEIKEGALPLKKGLDIKKYGGYSSLQYGFYSLISGLDKKGNKKIMIIPVPTMYGQLPDENYKEYLAENSKLSDINVLIKNLKVNTVITINNSKFCITGVTNASYVIKNLIQHNYSYDELKLIKLNEKAYSQLIDKKIITKDYKFKAEDIEKYENNYIVSKARGDKNKEESLDKNKEKQLFDIYKKAISSKIYFDFSNLQNIRIFLESEEINNILNKLSVLELICLNHEVNHLFTCDRLSSNLKLINGKEKSGVLTISSSYPNDNKCQIIAESVTGFYKKVLWKGE